MSEELIGPQLTLLRLVARFLGSLSADEVDRLLAGQSKLSIVDTTTKRVPTDGADAPAMTREEIIAAFSEIHTREEGLAALNRLAKNKSSLQRITQALDLPNRKSDTVDDLRKRIIEATVGYRLRSNAVQGHLHKDQQSLLG
ncbi:hypothetical protein AB0M35_02570 [Micromonospora sp. NPDC051196]|uniref:hypothetical protein n=1 Tax=Micromonospora sp. NPDC051196 TaxID=3155281 RepID=UPI003427839D